MGDGRYYTYVQFFNIIFLTFLVVLTLVSMVSCFYKNRKREESKQIAVVFMLIFLIIIARIIEETAVHLTVAYALKYFESVILILVIFIMANYLVEYVALYKEKVVKIIKKTLIGFLVVFISIILLDFIIEKPLLIIEYSFTEILFTKLYSYIIFIAGVVFLAISIEILFMLFKKNIKKYVKINIAFYIVFTFSFIFLIYSVLIYNQSKYMNLFGLFIYLIVTLGLNMLVDSFISYSATASILPNLKDIILDYVFVLDNKGTIIYKNNKADESNLFFKLDKIDIKNISNIFTESVEHHVLNDKNYLEIYVENKKYFSYFYKDIKNKGKSIGVILTFTDITYLISMINKLKEKKKNSECINNELNQYSKIVYRLEQEHEINLLLKEIATTQEKSLIKLKDQINNIINNNLDNFEENIDIMINSCKKNLSDVRSAVSKYMEYYGGRDD